MINIDRKWYVQELNGTMREVFPFKFVRFRQDYDLKEVWGVEFSPHVLDMYGKHLESLILREIADRVADEIVKQHLPSIIASLDQQAIANMTIAAAGAKVNETLNKKMPDKILEINRETTNNVRHWW